MLSLVMQKYIKRLKSNWIQRHVSDEFVRNSKTEGYRARSAYKLLEIMEKFYPINQEICRPNSIFVDLGAAPGSWSQVLGRHSDSTSKILAIDVLKLESLNKTIFIQQDFSLLRDDDFFNKLQLEMKPNSNHFDIILSDMCVELSGNSVVDNNRNSELWQAVLDFSVKFLKTDKHLIIKVFNSNEMVGFREKARSIFSKIHNYKPRSSRSDSSELYLICLSKRQQINK